MPTSKRFLDWHAGIAVVIAMIYLSLRPMLVDAGELSPVEAVARVELRLPDLDGQDRALDEFRGKVVLVNFWASWCTPCIEEMPGIQRLAEDMRDKPFAVIGINVGEARLRVKTMVQRLGIRFPILLDRDREVFHRWGATVLPTTYVLDENGSVRYVGRGALEWDGIEVIEILERLVPAEAAATALP